MNTETAVQPGVVTLTMDDGSVWREDCLVTKCDDWREVRFADGTPVRWNAGWVRITPLGLRRVG